MYPFHVLLKDHFCQKEPIEVKLNLWKDSLSADLHQQNEFFLERALWIETQASQSEMSTAQDVRSSCLFI